MTKTTSAWTRGPGLARTAIAVIIAVGTLSPSHVLAGAGSGAAIITRLNLRLDGSMLRIELDRPVVNPDGCTGEEFYVIERDPRNPDGFEAALSMVTVAFLAGKKVEFYVGGCTTKTWWGLTRPTPYDIYVAE